MVRFLSILVCALIGMNARAQFLPLELDQAVSLPTTSMRVWDILPHPDGYFLWVAVRNVNEQSRVYWGRTDVAGYDSLDILIGAPQTVAAFWRNNYEATVLFSSRHTLAGGLDSTVFRVYRLEGWVADDQFWWWQAIDNPGPWGGYRRDYRLTSTALLPPPPQITVEVMGLISYRWNGRDMGFDYYLSNTTTCTNAVLHMLNPSDTTIGINYYAGRTSWTVADDAIYLGVSGSYTRTITREWGSSTTYGGRLRVLRADSDSLLQTSAYIQGCGESDADDCITYPTATVYDSANAVAITVSRISGVTGAVKSSMDSTLAWSSFNQYFLLLGADVVSGNNREEFLGYRVDADVFEILDAWDGHSYGISTELIVNDSTARVVSRYDSAFRRLAFRQANQLYLYRFGEYLPADDNFIPHPSSFSLSSYPNPFNPSTTLSFSLPQPQDVRLAVYDVTGREVRVVTEGRYEAGDHRTVFDGSELPSGIYFAHLSAGSRSMTQKLLLLK